MNNLVLSNRLWSRVRGFRTPLDAPKALLILFALALGGCTEGMQSPQTIAAADTGEVTVQPIRVCDDSGNSCAQVNLFADITAKILAQAKLKVSFLPINQLNATRFLSIDSDNVSRAESEFYQLTRTGGSGAFGRNSGSTNTSGPINVWFVDTLESTAGYTQFGLAWVGANGVVISSATLDFNNGSGRSDTLAHEIGHNLGLTHGSGDGNPNNVMTDGSNRNIPRSVDDITPTGAGLDVLSNSQIKAIRSSGFVVKVAGDALASVTPAADRSSLIEIAGLSQSALRPGLGFRVEPPTSASTALSTADPTAVPEPTSGWFALSLSGGLMLLLTRRSGDARRV